MIEYTQEEWEAIAAQLQKIIDAHDLYLWNDPVNPNPGTIMCKRCGQGEEELTANSCIG